VCIQAAETGLAAANAKLQAEHEAAATDLRAAKQQVSDHERQHDDFAAGLAAAQQQVGQLADSCEVRLPCCHSHLNSTTAPFALDLTGNPAPLLLPLDLVIPAFLSKKIRWNSYCLLLG
jgi:hypothetical protein